MELDGSAQIFAFVIRLECVQFVWPILIPVSDFFFHNSFSSHEKHVKNDLANLLEKTSLTSKPEFYSGSRVRVFEYSNNERLL